MIRSLLDTEKMIREVACSIDLLDTYECEPKVITQVITNVLRAMGYSETDCQASVIFNHGSLDAHFANTYWQSGDYRHKVAILMAAVKTSIQSIERGDTANVPK